MAVTTEAALETLDTTDVDRWIGRPLGGGQLKEPVTANDIRRWVQAMHNPNPIHYDDDAAAKSVFGKLTAPQSFTICCDVGHGAPPAIQGKIPGSHMLFGGDEWWFFGPRIEPGDKLHSERLAFDYKVTNTKFAGPTMFQRGDTTYVNQRGQIIAKQRSTSIRYLAANARKLDSLKEFEQDPEWTDEQITRIEDEKIAYYKTFRDQVRRTFAQVQEGEALPKGVLGPHSIATFTTEWRAYIMTVWGASRQDTTWPTSTMEAGWLPQMSRDEERAKTDPAMADGAYAGASRGHLDPKYARLIGMPRGYGYGASMGAWVIDYVTNWAGQNALLVHSAVQYRSPALTGDVTYLTGKVTARERATDGGGRVTAMVEMATQTGAIMAKGPVEVRFHS
jgi:acyl dehydratase